jgi:hypothetical protein
VQPSFGDWACPACGRGLIDVDSPVCCRNLLPFFPAPLLSCAHCFLGGYGMLSQLTLLGNLDVGNEI